MVHQDTPRTATANLSPPAREGLQIGSQAVFGRFGGAEVLQFGQASPKGLRLDFRNRPEESMSRVLLLVPCLLVLVGCSQPSEPATEQAQKQSDFKPAESSQSASDTSRPSSGDDASSDKAFKPGGARDSDAAIGLPDKASANEESPPQKVADDGQATVKVEFLKLLTPTDVIKANLSTEDIGAFHKRYTKIVTEVLQQSTASCQVMVKFTLRADQPHKLVIGHKGNAPEALLQTLHTRLSSMPTHHTKKDPVSFQTVYSVTDSRTAARRKATATADAVSRLEKLMKADDRKPVPKAPNISPAQALADAKRLGWVTLKPLIEHLGTANESDYPGIRAWLADFRKATKGIDDEVDPASWPQVAIDELVTRNPHFWQAYFEMPPADPGVTALHGALLQLAGEFSRSTYILLVGLQRPGIDEEIAKLMRSQIFANELVFAAFDVQVRAGIKQFDAGDYAAAEKSFRDTLQQFPNYGWCLFELGLTYHHQDAIAAGRKPPKLGSVQTNEQAKLSGRVLEQYRLARRHDPLFWRAYQGSDKKVINSVMALTRFGLPAWKKIVSAKAANVSDKNLMTLGAVAQVAQIHDLALGCIQVIVARRGNYATQDFGPLRENIQALASGPPIDRTIERLAGKRLKLFQLIPVNGKGTSGKLTKPADKGDAKGAANVDPSSGSAADETGRDKPEGAAAGSTDTAGID